MSLPIATLIEMLEAGVGSDTPEDDALRALDATRRRDAARALEDIGTVREEDRFLAEYLRGDMGPMPWTSLDAKSALLTLDGDPHVRARYALRTAYMVMLEDGVHGYGWAAVPGAGREFVADPRLRLEFGSRGAARRAARVEREAQVDVVAVHRGGLLR